MGIQSLLHYFYQRKALSCFAGFLIGIAIHGFFPLTAISYPIWMFLSILVFFFFLSSFFFIGYRNRLFYVLLVYSALLFGLWRFDVAIPAVSFSNHEIKTYRATVQRVWKGNYGLNAIVDVVPESWTFASSTRLQLYLSEDLPLGSLIQFTCTIEATTRREGETVHDFASWLHYAQGRCRPKDLRVVRAPAWWDPRPELTRWRSWANQRIASVMPGDEGVLIAGILYGERDMSAEAQDLFRRAGLTHLIAVSGSNFTIVVSIVFALMLGLGCWRVLAFRITSLIMLIFMGFVGFSASVARAALMGWLVLLGRQLGRVPQTTHVLLFTAAALCLLDPWMLAFDASFALSFLATIGLMVWSPIFMERLTILPEAGGIREASATTLAASVMTIPYIAFVFERLSLAGLLTNIIAVPLVPWAMLFGAISAAAGDSWVGTILSVPTLGLAKGVFLAAEIVNVFPWLDIHISRMSFVGFAGTYLCLARIWFYIRKKNQLYTRTELFCQPPL